MNRSTPDRILPELEGLSDSNVEGTLLVPLLGRARAAQRFPEVLPDPAGDRLLHDLGVTVRASTNAERFGDFCYVVRSHAFDRMVRDFLERNPDGVVLELGAGLDTTFWRAGQKARSWYAVDFPSVARLRGEYLQEDPRLCTVAADLSENSWMERVETAGKPVLVIACGVLHYLSHDRVARLMDGLQAAFGGVDVGFDCSSKDGLKHSQRQLEKAGSSARMVYWVDGPEAEVERWGVGAKLLESGHYFRGAPVPRGIGIKARIFMGLVALTRGSRIVRAHLPTVAG